MLTTYALIFLALLVTAGTAAYIALGIGEERGEQRAATDILARIVRAEQAQFAARFDTNDFEQRRN